MQSLVDVRVTLVRGDTRTSVRRSFPSLEKEGLTAVCARDSAADGPHRRTASIRAGATKLSGICGLHANRGIRRSHRLADGLPQLDNTVIMCAEAVPWRCHRSLIGTQFSPAKAWWKIFSCS